jgi:hypothetical protein
MDKRFLPFVRTETTMPLQHEDNSRKRYSTVQPYDAEDDQTFSYEGFQVTRGEYYAHSHEPTIVLSDYRVYVNRACLQKAPDVEYVQILVNREKRKLVIRPCEEDERDSFPWCTVKRRIRRVTCQMFFVMLVDMMDWNPEHRYKVIGKMIRHADEYLFVFDLSSAETYQRQIVLDENGQDKRRTSRKAVYPNEWKGQFGLPVEEHRMAVQINIFDGFAVYGIKNAGRNATVNPPAHGGDQE